MTTVKKSRFLVNKNTVKLQSILKWVYFIRFVSKKLFDASSFSPQLPRVHMATTARWAHLGRWHCGGTNITMVERVRQYFWIQKGVFRPLTRSLSPWKNLKGLITCAVQLLRLKTCAIVGDIFLLLWNYKSTTCIKTKGPLERTHILYFARVCWSAPCAHSCTVRSDIQNAWFFVHSP